ncbi:hypothetical protein C0J52_00271, partial [Blattella germanica]
NIQIKYIKISIGLYILNNGCCFTGKKKDRCESAHYFLVCIKNEFIAFLVNMFTS